MLLRNTLLFLSLSLAAPLCGQVQVRSSSEGLLSVTFTDFTEFEVLVAGDPDEILIVLENAYTSAQSPLTNQDVSGFTLPFLDIDEFDVSSWGLSIGQGSAAAGTLGQIDPRDLVIHFKLLEDTPIGINQTVAFGIGGVLSNVPFPVPNGLTSSTPVFFAGTASPFRTNRLVQNATLLPLNPEPAGLCAESLDDGIIPLTLSGAGGDRVLMTSSNLIDWNTTNLFVPADSKFTMPVATRGGDRQFYRLSAPRAEFPLEGATPSVSGLQLQELREGGGYRYFFNPDGTGEQFDASATLNWDFVWTESASPGITTAAITFTDGYREFINLQAPLVEVGGVDFYGYRTFAEGFQGRSDSGAIEIGISTAAKPTVANLVPPTLTGLSFVLTQPSLAGLPLTFDTATTATGPAIADGSASTWSYRYLPTGNNTASLEFTDGRGDFLRLYLTFQSGFSPDASASSSVVSNAFGRTDNYFILEAP